MSTSRITVSKKRNYNVINTEQAKKIAKLYLDSGNIDEEGMSFGLPEIHDRYDEWHVPILYLNNTVGAISINAFSEKVDQGTSSDLSNICARIVKINNTKNNSTLKRKKNKPFHYRISELESTIALGRSELILEKLPEQSIDMIFTSPPYYNARKEYSEYDTYDDYLDSMREIIRQCKRVLIDGKFFIINSSHVLIPRASRSESSNRIAVPFDLHQIFMEEGFEFVDDIIWQKPEGAGWASGRGRRFSADRNPMQYKAVPVTEYVMVYRKKPLPLIDNFIRKHPHPELVEQSKIKDGYEKTNVWYISPARDKRHPAIFPKELAEKVIKYYSFKNDVVLDPFGGIGTTAKAAKKLDRRFYSIELNEDYVDEALKDIGYSENSLFEDNKIEYKDYSDLKNEKVVNKSIRSIINDLLNQGLSEEEIKRKLIE